MKDLVFEQKENAEALLKSVDVSAYFYFDYWEFCGGQFYELKKTYPAGTITLEQLMEEVEKLYEENFPYYEKKKHWFGKAATMCIFIGFFDEDSDFRVVADKVYS